MDSLSPADVNKYGKFYDINKVSSTSQCGEANESHFVTPEKKSPHEISDDIRRDIHRLIIHLQPTNILASMFSPLVHFFFTKIISLDFAYLKKKKV